MTKVIFVNYGKDDIDKATISLTLANANEVIGTHTNDNFLSSC